jgi:predicted enzyme related to lactoylglutathione lyase
MHMVGSQGRFVWYELMTTNIDAAKVFYANVLGWGTRDASMPGLAYSQFTVGDVPVAGMLQLPDEARRMGIPPHWLGYVGVDDVDAAAVRVSELGGAVHVPPTDISTISRFSVVADPQMAIFALITGRESEKAREPEKAKPVDLTTLGHVGWHELLATDWEKAFAFYSVLLGWQKADAQEGAMGIYQQVSAAGEPFGGLFTKPLTLPFPFWLYYFNVSNLEAAAKRVLAGGGQILYGPMAVPGGASIVHCMDPQGAVFALLDRRRRKAIGYFIPPKAPR